MIAIIGGGVFGLAIGWYVAQAGRDVTVFEQGRAGQGATWAAAGMLMPWKLSESFSDELFELQRVSYQQWPAFAETLADASCLFLDYQTNGRYFVALMDKAVGRLQRQYDFHRQLGFPVEWLSGAEARARVPALGPEVLAAIFTPMAHHVDNRQVVLALREAFVRAGGILREQTAVREILSEGQQVRGLRLTGETVSAETVVVTAGAWSGQIPGLPESLRRVVRPRKGQTVTLQMSPDAPLIRQPILGPVYLVPRADGRLIVGTTVEREAGFDTQPTAGGVYHILRKAQAMVPDVAELPLIEMGAGLRPTGPNRQPVLGPTEVEGLLLASGGHSYGILLTPAVADAISRLILIGQMSLAIEPFSPQSL